MDKKTYVSKMKEHENSFNKLWWMIVADTNDYVENNPKPTMYSLDAIGKFVDTLCLSGAWIQDRINGKSGVYSTTKYRGSLTKKIRKALGFTY